MASVGAIPVELFGFKVVDKVGEGAASAVYAVMDTKSRQVMALKHVHRRSEKDQRFIEQIEQEYKVGSRLEHPNIRAITRYLKNQRFMFGPVTDVALLMELVDAATLDVMPRPSAENIARYFAQGAHALAHMHERGFVHADMKPSNMMVTEDGTVKIIDLGQACSSGSVKKRIQGTPGYIAPEQAHRKEVTPLTDVYNYGATLYWVLLREEIPCALPSRHRAFDAGDGGHPGASGTARAKHARDGGSLRAHRRDLRSHRNGFGAGRAGGKFRRAQPSLRQRAQPKQLSRFCRVLLHAYPDAL
jgi:serine/threonine-protein kinase